MGKGKDQRGDASAPRDRFFAALTELVLQKPLARIPLNEVISTVGVTKGSFYAQFESREALAAAFVYHEFDRALSEVGTRLIELTPSIELLVAAMFETTRYLLDNPRFHAALLVQAEVGRDPDHPIEDVARWQEFLATQLATAKESGDLRTEINVDDLADLLLAAWTGARILSDLASGHDDLIGRIQNLLTTIVGPVLVPDRAIYFETFTVRYAGRMQ